MPVSRFYQSCVVLTALLPFVFMAVVAPVTHTCLGVTGEQKPGTCPALSLYNDSRPESSVSSAAAHSDAACTACFWAKNTIGCGLVSFALHDSEASEPRVFEAADILTSSVWHPSRPRAPPIG